MSDTKSRRSVYIWIAFGIATLATIFDAISSWQIIELNPIAVEADSIWRSIAHVIGFAGAMVLRALVGIVLLIALLFAALRSKRSPVRELGTFGIYFSAVVLFSLSVYHICFRQAHPHSALPRGDQIANLPLVRCRREALPTP